MRSTRARCRVLVLDEEYQYRALSRIVTEVKQEKESRGKESQNNKQVR